MDSQMLLQQQLITIKRNFGIIMKNALKFPSVGLIISFALSLLGYYLKYIGVHNSMREDDLNLLSTYIIISKFSYFYSAIIFLISSVVLIRASLKKIKGSFAEQRKSLSDLQELSWKDFKEYIISLFEKLDYSLVDSRVLNDESTDLTLKKDNRLSLVRCNKFYVRKVNLWMVLEFHDAMSREPNLEKGYFITTGFFSREAKKFASDKKIELIDGVKFMDFVRIAASIDEAEKKAIIQHSLKSPDYESDVRRLRWD